MHFIETKLSGAFIIESEPVADHRGFFARSWCRDEFAARGLNTRIAQCNIVHSEKAGTLRGIHFQTAPYAEAKLVRCTQGAVFDVLVDLRHDSPTRGRWEGVELTAANRRMVYVPEGFGHAFQTLTDDAEIHYQASEFYHPESAFGVRFDDSAFAIHWPLEVTSVSEADRKWPDYVPEFSGCCHVAIEGAER